MWNHGQMSGFGRSSPWQKPTKAYPPAGSVLQRGCSPGQLWHVMVSDIKWPMCDTNYILCIYIHVYIYMYVYVRIYTHILGTSGKPTMICGCNAKKLTNNMIYGSLWKWGTPQNCHFEKEISCWSNKKWIPYVQTNPYCLHQFGYAYLPTCVKFTEKSPKTTHDQKAAARQQNYV